MRALKITPTVTNREEKSLEKYFTEISRHEVLSPEEEYRLFTTTGPDREAALEKIVEHNLRFVVSVAKKYQNCGMALSDLINEGNLGLIKAAERFDHSRGFKFISYAVWWIRQSIIAAINENGKKIRTPLNLNSIQSKLDKERITFTQRHEREPTYEELAERLDISEELVSRVTTSYKRCASLDKPVGDDSDATMGNLMEDDALPAPDHGVAIVEGQQKIIDNMLQSLSEKQAYVIKSYFGIDREISCSLSNIAEDLGISRERVRQIRDRSLRTLRSHYDFPYEQIEMI
ncbi:MAG: RNA polymerase sigma factor RpoD/SigA [Saprospiraceae bacterium]|nr:RNA polymerase sigma factor RpoD/SigA [Saprospiraceae bacterium]